MYVYINITLLLGVIVHPAGVLVHLSLHLLHRGHVLIVSIFVVIRVSLSLSLSPSLALSLSLSRSLALFLPKSRPLGKGRFLPPRVHLGQVLVELHTGLVLPTVQYIRYTIYLGLYIGAIYYIYIYTHKLDTRYTIYDNVCIYTVRYIRYTIYYILYTVCTSWTGPGATSVWRARKGGEACTRGPLLN